MPEGPEGKARVDALGEKKKQLFCDCYFEDPSCPGFKPDFWDVKKGVFVSSQWSCPDISDLASKPNSEELLADSQEKFDRLLDSPTRKVFWCDCRGDTALGKKHCARPAVFTADRERATGVFVGGLVLLTIGIAGTVYYYKIRLEWTAKSQDRS